MFGSNRHFPDWKMSQTKKLEGERPCKEVQKDDIKGRRDEEVGGGNGGSQYPGRISNILTNS